jgi:signal transduction histidine kinase
MIGAMQVDNDEEARVAALRRYCSLDAPAEPEMLGVLRTAVALTGVPTAAINLLDEQVQHNYVTVGFAGGRCPKSDSMCRVTVVERRRQNVADAARDPRFIDNPWVDGRLGRIRFYAAAPLRTPEGHVIGTLCVFDERSRVLDDARLAALEDLAALVMGLLERRRLAREATAATEAKSRFLAAVSHELRTPLGGILGTLDLLLGSRLDPRQARLVDLARRAGETLLALLDGLLDLSKGEAGHVVLARVPFDPAGVVEDVVDVLSSLTARRGTTLEVRIEGDAPRRLIGDPNRLRQVLANLIGNALKFTSAGGVEVVVRGGGRLSIDVRDTGDGIPPEEMARLFQPYAQGSAGARHGGTGLGLWISRELVRMMGGSLTCASTVGVGTTFTVSLAVPPVEEAPPRPPATSICTEVVPGGTTTDPEVVCVAVSVSAEAWGTPTNVVAARASATPAAPAAPRPAPRPARCACAARAAPRRAG